MDSKTYELLQQARKLLAQAEYAASKEQEWAAMVSISGAREEVENAYQRTTQYQIELAEELAKSWKMPFMAVE